MIALEEYTAHHSDTAEEIMYAWGWRRFERMFRLHLLRKAREELRQMRDLRLAALDANMNYDSQENQQAKTSRMEALQDAYRQGERILYAKPGELEQSVEEATDDPLFSRTARSRLNQASTPLAPQAGMGRQLIEAT
jgi:hypothetical protein